ncbi:hypothetical protein CCACVL1_27161 [Corchorus capsularis]|uniref:Uncharacterized protein n=1 Tax=Corchorus capsularis TaxID=210143 RepID=A0A1R3GBY5_COCAP|nr:hypothetical protein CCACVL1_27161 [Corchorus capsularis]
MQGELCTYPDIDGWIQSPTPLQAAKNIDEVTQPPVNINSVSFNISEDSSPTTISHESTTIPIEEAHSENLQEITSEPQQLDFTTHTPMESLADEVPQPPTSTLVKESETPLMINPSSVAGVTPSSPNASSVSTHPM